MTPLRAVVAAASALACACALAQGGAAAPASAAPAASAAAGKKELVQRVLQLQQGASDNVALALARQSVASLNQQLQDIVTRRVPADQREAVVRDIQAEFKKYGDEVVPMLRERAARLVAPTVGTLLEERFAEDELRQLVAMFESPIFRKYQQVAPELDRALLEKLLAESRPELEPKLRALQQSVGKRLTQATRQAPAASSAAPARGAAASAPRPAASAPRR